MSRAGPRALRAAALAAAYERQEREIERTGFVAQPELGRALLYWLRRRGCPRSFTVWGAHAAAVGTDRNYQGQPRLARLTGYSVRTCQRARLWFEQRGLIRSEILEPGDRLPKMRAPSWRPMVVRFVGELQDFARLGAAYVPPWKRGKASVAHVTSETTPEQFDELARDAPEFAAFFHGMAAAERKRRQKREQPAPPPAAATVDPIELDAIDRELAELSRGPPRAPPN